MIRTQVYIPEDLHREALLVAKVHRVNFSTLVRQGLNKIVQEKKRVKTKKLPLASLIGVYKGKVKTNAVKDIHDYYRYEAI